MSIRGMLALVAVAATVFILFLLDWGSRRDAVEARCIEAGAAGVKVIHGSILCIDQQGTLFVVEE